MKIGSGIKAGNVRKDGGVLNPYYEYLFTPSLHRLTDLKKLFIFSLFNLFYNKLQYILNLLC